MSNAEVFKQNLFKKAASKVVKVVLPESEDERVLRASEILAASKAVEIILLGDEGQVRANAEKFGVNLAGISVVDPLTSALKEEFAQTLFELRKAKGLTEEKAVELMKDKTFLGR